MTKPKTTSSKTVAHKPKPPIKKVPINPRPLTLIANLAVALADIGIDVPILDVAQDGDDLVIVLYGGRVKRFPLDYNLVVSIDKINGHKKEDAPVRLAASVLGRDKYSPDDWTPDVEKFVK